MDQPNHEPLWPIERPGCRYQGNSRPALQEVHLPVCAQAQLHGSTFALKGLIDRTALAVIVIGDQRIVGVDREPPGDQAGHYRGQWSHQQEPRFGMPIPGEGRFQG
jgi:hypothetical protein